ncbi:MAG: hypothetical protein UHD09_08390 [Bifidobacterium sp.]|nr:hypothetical protein [Bifidobacterium sp.]
MAAHARTARKVAASRTPRGIHAKHNRPRRPHGTHAHPGRPGLLHRLPHPRTSAHRAARRVRTWASRTPADRTYLILSGVTMALAVFGVLSLCLFGVAGAGDVASLVFAMAGFLVAVTSMLILLARRPWPDRRLHACRVAAVACLGVVIIWETASLFMHATLLYSGFGVGALLPAACVLVGVVDNAQRERAR